MSDHRDMTPPILWQYSFSNFNEKARWALDFKRIPHVRRSVLPGSPRARAFSRRGTLPALDLDGERVVDSTRIIEALERRWPDPPLYPADEGERRAALELEEFFDEELGHDARRVLFNEISRKPRQVHGFLATGQGRAGRGLLWTLLPLTAVQARRRYRFYPADIERSRKKVLAALDRIAAETRGSGYLVGARFTVADLTAASLVYLLARPQEFQYELPKLPLFDFERQVADHPAVEWVAEMWRRHRGVSAEAKRG